MRDRTALLVIGALSGLILLAVAGLWLGGPSSGAGRHDVSALPAVNAALNGTSAVLLGVGFVFIRRRQVAAHRVAMMSAFGVSTCFLISYVVYHAQVGSVSFTGQGWIRPVYFTLLVSHIVLAAAILPLALVTIHRAWSARFDRHRRVARWTLPLWLYVSLSGVAIYWMLYRV